MIDATRELQRGLGLTLIVPPHFGRNGFGDCGLNVRRKAHGPNPTLQATCPGFPVHVEVPENPATYSRAAVNAPEQAQECGVNVPVQDPSEHVQTLALLVTS